MRFALPLLLILVLPLAAVAAYDGTVLEEVGERYRGHLDGLASYAVTVETDKVAEMIARMTADLPPEVARPEVPRLTKFWSQRAGRSVVLAEGRNLLPTMRQMVERYSGRYALDLPFALLPPERAADRARHFAAATATFTESRIGDSRSLVVAMQFPEPTDLDGAFYRPAVGLPQQAVRTLSFDIDLDRGILRQIQVVTAQQKTLTMDIGHHTVSGRPLPDELHITAPDGSLDDRLEAVLGEVRGFWLPLRQARTVLQDGQRETVNATFTGYRFNVPLPPAAQAFFTEP